MELDTSDLDAQIAALQAERAKKLRKADYARAVLKKEQEKVLIGSTPTKPALRDVELPTRPAPPVFVPRAKVVQALPSVPTPGPSRMSTSLATLRRSNPSASSSHKPLQQERSSSTKGSNAKIPEVSERSGSRAGSMELEVEDKKSISRDQNSLAIIEELVPGPREFGRDPEGEEEWMFLEPNSGVRLSKRSLPHALLQAHLSGRYYLSPSLLYSVIRLSRDGATYHIPVQGDWVVIAVVAERGEIRVSGMKNDRGSDEDEEDLKPKQASVKQGVKGVKDKAAQGKDEGKGGEDQERWRKRRGPRKYINLKLCALPPRIQSKGPSGDAMLQLLLFESDAIVREDENAEDDDGETKKTYRGGSGGAYEKWCNLGVGSVIAILNPRVLRPLRSGNQAPHPLTLPLALNPTSAEGITLIGQSRDLGCCSAQQKDGNRCKTWVDLRQSQVCEYHVHAAVHRGRAGRAEFTASTNGFALQTRGGSTSAKRAGFDPKRRTGLLPASGAQAAPRQDNGGSGAIYVVSGNTVSTHRADGGLKHFGDEHLSEKLGRGRAEKRKRTMEDRVAEAALSKLLERDGKSGSTGAKYLAALDRGKGKKKGKGEKEDEEERKRPFSAGAIKRIGFDPTSRHGAHDGEDAAKRLEAIASLKGNPDRPIKLGRPKGLGRSNVRAPPLLSVESERVGVEADGTRSEGMVDLD